VLNSAALVWGATFVPDVHPARSTIRFGVFDLDVRAGELRKLGVKIKLQGQPFQILRILLERAGEVVTREELQKEIWPADTFVDFDHGLYNAIKKLREVLGDTADTPRFIETIPKRGYRFIAPITSEVTSHRNWLAPVAAIAGFVLLLVLLFWLNVGHLRTKVLARNDPPVIHSLAVLPLKNLSADPSQEYFAYGMTEELITNLAQIPTLKLISHTSTIQYANSTKPLPQIARELGVDGIIEGSVQRSGDRVRITAQLIYAPDEQHRWAASYDGDLKDMLTLERQVATEIVESIRPQTASTEPVLRKAAASPGVDALKDYLQGIYAAEQGSAGSGYDGYQAAITFFKKAIAEDPTFAMAYIKLADVSSENYKLPKDYFPLVEDAVMKALKLDPGLAEAHVGLADIQGDHCDFSAAANEAREAIRLSPSLASAHESLAEALDHTGLHEQALAEVQLAQELDPGGFEGVSTMVANGQYDRAIAVLRKHLEIRPNDGAAYVAAGGLIDAYHFAGKHREAAEALQRGWTLYGFKEQGEGVRHAYANSGYAETFRYSAKQLARLYTEGKLYETPYIATFYARAGDKEQALKWLKQTYEDFNYCWPGLQGKPDFAFLRSDPRYQELVRFEIRRGQRTGN